jgi:hypothetical protein
VSDVATNAAGAADLLGVDEVDVSQLSCGKWTLCIRIGDAWWGMVLTSPLVDNIVSLGREAFELARAAKQAARIAATQALAESQKIASAAALQAQQLANEFESSDEPGSARPRTRFDAIAEEMLL